MTIDQMKEKLKSMLIEKRYKHSLMVMETAKAMAEHHGANVEKAVIAGLLHDCAKNFTASKMIELCNEYGIALDDVMLSQTGLIHGFLGVEIAKREFGIEDEEILDAIKWHTVGKENMPLLTKIIYIADGIEPLRQYDGVDRIRELAYTDIDRALVYQIDNTIKSILSRGTLLHINTVNTRNYYLKEIR